MPEHGAASARVCDLRRVYGHRGAENVVVVDGVSFDVRRGESVAIVGESGSGKTTITRILMGLVLPTSGAVEIEGTSLGTARMSAWKRRQWAKLVQMVFQDCYASLDPRQGIHHCVEEALALHQDIPRPELAHRAVMLLEQGGIYSDTLPRCLPGGQRQRVAIARALAVSPRVPILDEAVAPLDASIQGQVLNLLAEIRDASPD
jgi:ABC-type glutathione transport system ATPase component